MQYKSKEIGSLVNEIIGKMNRVRELNEIGTEEHTEEQIKLQQDLYTYGIATSGNLFFSIDPATKATREIKL